MWVVKLGGSLAKRGELRNWLELLASYGGGEVILVPGGGPFADQVREFQARWAFSDRVAHAMALRAMEQFGLMMTGLRTDLVPASTVAELQRVRERAQVPVWLPVAAISTARDIPADWSVTSDSLAAWLSHRLGSDRLVLVKAAELGAGITPLEGLVDRGVVDPAFPAFLAGFEGEAWIFHTCQGKLLQQALYSGICHGATRLLTPGAEEAADPRTGEG